MRVGITSAFSRTRVVGPDSVPPADVEFAKLSLLNSIFASIVRSTQMLHEVLAPQSGREPGATNEVEPRL